MISVNSHLFSKRFSPLKLKVLYVTGALSYGGLERVVINLCKGINKDKFEATVVCIKSMGEFADELMADNIKVINLNANRNRWAKYTSWYQLKKIIEKEKIDIIHTHNTAAFIDATLALRFVSHPVLIHTDHARSFPDKRRYMLAERFSARFAEQIVAVSYETQENLVKFEGMSRKKIIVINNGIEKNSYDIDVDRDAKLDELGLQGFDHIIGLGVVLTTQKGITHLIKAAPRILKEYPRTAFVIAGDGPIKEELQGEVQELGLDKSFFFLGPRKDIPEILQILDIYVLPSEWEGLPLVILEAMAAKRCILATNVGAVPLALKDGFSGILIRPKDPDLIAMKVIELISNPAFRHAVADNAYQDFLQHFTVEQMVKHYEKVYCDALQSKRRELRRSSTLDFQGLI